MARLFVACDLPPQVEQAVAAWQDDELRPLPDLRVMGSLHITLCFLGTTPQSKVQSISDVLATIAWDPIETALSEPLFLPERGSKRVVALGLADDHEALRALQAQISDALVALGIYKAEKRAYLPHLTVARYRHPGRAFSLQNVNESGFGLAQFTLYNSVLERAGAVHTPLATFPAR
jgi:2'-5' RNA ligase